MNQHAAGTGDPDWAVRDRAFAALEQLTSSLGGQVHWERLARGFELDGERIHFASRALGIFKPKQMTSALSIRTSKPRPERATWYRDQHAEMDVETGLVSYDLVQDARHPSNEHLRLAFEREAPLIYLHAVETALYELIWPVWVQEVRSSEGRVLLSATKPIRSEPTAAGPMHGLEVMERVTSYSIGVEKRRNHQAWFSSRTRAAYGYRCAFSGLPLGGLLVGAHIKADKDGGPSSVTNGICMSTLHHAAFDGYLIGVDPESRIHVARRVMDTRDGPLLKSLQMLEGHTLRAPADSIARPDPEFLAWRFERFRRTRG